MRAIGYIRVSTREQGDSRLGLDAQRKVVENGCERDGFELLRFEQDVTSGKSMNGRRGLAAAIDACERGEAEAIVVAKVDRLARSLLDYLNLAERSRKRGWALVVCDVPLDPRSPMGEAMLNVLATFAQLERRMISERTKSALAEARARGVVLGRPDQSPEVSDELAARINDMRASGTSYREIAWTLDQEGIPAPRAGHWNHETVRRSHLRTLT